MSRKKKNEDLEEIEKLQRENKSLRTMNRSLMRHLKKLNKGFKFEESEDEEEHNEDVCQECGKGQIIKVDLGVREFKRCEICLWRTKTTKKKN